MREIKPEDWKDFALQMLRTIDPQRIGVNWVSKSSFNEEFGRLASLQIYDNVVNAETVSRWQERIDIHLKGIPYVVEGNTRKWDDILGDPRLEQGIEHINICVRVLLKTPREEYMIRMFDKNYLVIESLVKNRRSDNNPKYRFDWLTVYDVHVDDYIEKVAELNDKEVAALQTENALAKIARSRGRL
mgnify:FL=1